MSDLNRMIYQSTAGAAEHLQTGSRTIYFGADITAPALHPGNMIGLLVLRELQKQGHQIILLLGGGTTLIGDPTGRTEERPLLSQETIKKNIVGIEKSMRLVLGDGARVVNNEDWLCKISWMEMLREVGTKMSINKLVKTDTFQKRLDNNHHLSFLEFSYPICQAYDFLYLNTHYGCTMQCGGSDQWANILAGVGLADGLFGITVPLLTDANGNKISKSTYGDAAWINPDLTSAFDLWQWYRNLPDSAAAQLNQWFLISESTEINVIKADIANYMTAIIHGEREANLAAEKSQKIFTEGAVAEFPEVAVEDHLQLFEILATVNFAQSNSEARRLIRQGSVVVNGAICTEECMIPSKPAIIQVGKKGRKLIAK